METKDKEIGIMLLLGILGVGVFFCITGLMVGLMKSEDAKTKEYVVTESKGDFSVVEIEVRGERHEYLRYDHYHRGSVTHLPNCKYCKETVK